MNDARLPALERTPAPHFPRLAGPRRAKKPPRLSGYCSLCPCPCQGFIEGRKQCASLSHPGALATSDHHKVPSLGKRVSATAKPFPNRSLDPVSLDGIADSAARADADPAGLSRGCGQHQEHESARGDPATLAGNPFEVSRVAQAIGPPEAAGQSVHNYFDATVVARRLRPLARRRFRIARPERVFIRSRNPCFRSRLMRLG